MLIFLICIGSIILAYLGLKHFENRYYDDIYVIFVLILIAAIAITTILGTIIVINNVTCSANTSKMQQTYNALTYQIEHINDLYETSHAVDKSTLMGKIQEWNENLAKERELHNSLWTNWWYPIDYSQFEYIKFN